VRWRDKHYAFAPSRDCVKQIDGAQVNSNKADLDYVAEDSGEGAFEADLGRNSVTVVFERTAGDADRTMSAYELFGEAFDASTEDILFQKNNVVIAWNKTPTDDEKSKIEGCLRS
jgi:hypothetical protein